jgi:ribonucleoside-diphosphate reductase beta chain
MLYSRIKAAPRGPLSRFTSPLTGPVQPFCSVGFAAGRSVTTGYKEGKLTTLSARIELGQFFQETSDPALQESADRGQVELLDYRELYELWERQQWLTQELDFSRDREDWQSFPEEERQQRMYGLSSFFIGEQRVTEELGPMMRAAPTEDMRIFLSTQIADEARHVRFFDAFYSQVGVLEADSLADRLDETSAHLNPAFGTLFDEMLGSRVQRLAEQPSDLEALVEAITLYHMVIEGMLALTGQHFIIDFNEREGTLPEFVRGFSLVARDEHRHVAFGARFLRDVVAERPELKHAIQRTLEESLQVADKVLSPPWIEDTGDYEVFGVNINETRTFAAQALTRRLKVIGLTPVTA